jgi:hypothetical protein
MHRTVFRRPSPALVIACIALFLAMGGVSYGVATGSINSREIRNNTILSRDVRNGKLLGRDLKRATVGGREVRESRLGTVPSAATVDGHNLARINYRVPAGTPTTAILGLGGLIINATCTPTGNLNVTATTIANNSMVHAGTVHAAGDNASYADNNDLDVGESSNMIPNTDTRVQGSLTYTNPTGQVVSVSYLTQERTNGLASANDCFVVGTATQSG